MIQKIFPWFAGFLLLISVIISIIGFLDPLPPITEKGSLLKSDSSIFIPYSKRYERQNLLSNIILTQQETYSNIFMATNNQRMQTRLSFVALLAVLLIPFLSSKIYNIKKVIILAIFILTVSIYFYDIHITDLSRRSSHTKILLDNTILEISNIKPTDSLWHYLSYEKTLEYKNKMHEHSRIRKLNNSLHPDLSQIAFYLSPFSLFLILYFLLPKKNNDPRHFRKSFYNRHIRKLRGKIINSVLRRKSKG